MKLKHDCVREFLLFIEDNLDGENFYRLGSGDKTGCTSCSVQEEIYLVEKLREAGFIDATISKYLGGGKAVFVRALTWNGHAFLDNIRPLTAWEKTKEILSKVGGGSLSIASEVAGKVLSELIKSYL